MQQEKVYWAELKLGNREAFRNLFRYYYPRLKAYVVTMINDEQAAEDMVQDTFLYVWEHRSELSVDDHMQSYLYKAAYTRCIDYFRKAHLEDQYCSDIYEEYAKTCESLTEQNASVLEELYSKDFYRELYELLQHIPEQRREVFILAYIEGKKTKEIADQMDMPVRTVESHLYLSIKYLKNKMSKKNLLLL